MHDLDRTQLELEEEAGVYGEEEFEWESYEEEDGEEELEFGSEFEGEFESMDEAMEMELASELLEVSDEEELEQFLGNLIKRGRKFLQSGTGKALGGILKNVAKQALPALIPGLGPLAAAGGAAQLVGQAGRMLGLELEGLSPEDSEFEVAKQFVRFANEAVNEASLAPPSVPPAAAAQTAATIAAQRYAPGLVGWQGRQRSWNGRRGRSGRWVRRGRTIVVYGA